MLFDETWEDKKRRSVKPSGKLLRDLAQGLLNREEPEQGPAEAYPLRLRAHARRRTQARRRAGQVIKTERSGCHPGFLTGCRGRCSLTRGRALTSPWIGCQSSRTQMPRRSRTATSGVCMLAAVHLDPRPCRAADDHVVRGTVTRRPRFRIIAGRSC